MVIGGIAVKKIITLLFSSLLLTGCSGVIDETKKITVEVNKTEPSQEELNEKLISESVQADFVELNSDQAEIGKRVFAVGEISFIKESGIYKSFTLTTKEGNGYGLFTITDILKSENYQDGDTVKIFGAYIGKDDLGFPKIDSSIIEKQ
jgi:colicin import membrane protein